jgi:macrolide transport system ATP-binding/permease protein
VNGLRQDIAFGLRLLARQPMLTSVIVLSLALGIGFNTAIFSFLDAIFLRPFPAVREPERVVALYSRDPNGAGLLPTSYPNFKDLRDWSRSFSAIASYQVIQVGLMIGNEAEQVGGEMVSANYFDVLGVKPVLGRTFLPEEDRTPGTHPVTILSYRLWTERYGGRPDILGRTVRVNNRELTIVGVAPREFTGSNVVLSPALWVPLMMYKQVFAFSDFFDQRGGRVLQIVARLWPGKELARAQAEMDTLASQLVAEYPEENEKLSFAVAPLSATAVPMDQRAVFVRAGSLLMGIVALLLLIACVNVANLLLARTLGRRREISLRASLGAGRGRILRQLLTESLLLSMLAGGVGLLLALWTRDLLWRFKPPYFADEALAFRFDPRILLFTALVSLATTLLFSTASAIEVAKPALASVLQEEGRSTGSRRSLPLRWLTIALQVALSLICLSCAGIFLRSLRETQRVDPGFDSDRLLAVSFNLRSQGYDEARARQFQERLLAAARALPGVEAATLAENRLLGGWSWWRKVPLGEVGPGGEDGVTAGSTIVGPEYFDTVGIPILRGRGFTPQDRDGTHPVVILNQTLADRVWPGKDPVGTWIRLDQESEPIEIVGIARDAKYRSLGEAPQPFLYLPILQRGSLRCTLHVRSARPELLLDAVRSEIRKLDAGLPVIEARPLSEVIERSLWAPRAGAVLLSVFGTVALVLSGVGIYGVTAYSVGRRRSEIGLRMALGARREQIAALILRQGMSPLVLGLAAGLAGSLAIQRWIAGLLYSGADGGRIWIPLAILILTLVGLIANLIPAARASRIDPASSLKDV